MTEEQNSRAVLEEAIRNLYSVFCSYGHSIASSYSSHTSLTADDVARLSGPLPRLSSDHLAKYAMKALTTWGGPDDFRHFLPRLLELAAFEERGWTDVAILIGKLRDGDWREWPSDEQKAIEQYLVAVWRWTLWDPKAPRSATDWLLGLYYADIDMSCALENWRQIGSTNATKHLADLVLQEKASLLKSGNVARWRGVAGDLVSEFVKSDHALERLEHHFHIASHDVGETISDALSIVEAAKLPNRG